MNLDFNPNTIYCPLDWYQNADIASTFTQNFQCYAPQELSVSGMQSGGHSSYESKSNILHFRQLNENIQEPWFSSQMLFEDQKSRHNYSHPNYNSENYNNYLGNKCELLPYASNIYQNETNTKYGSYHMGNNREGPATPHSMSKQCF